MAINDTLLNIGNAAMQAVALYMSTHTDTPDATGSNEGTGTRQSITWETAASGDMIVTTDVEFTDLGTSEAVEHIGFWSAATDGTFYGSLPVTGDQTANSAGEYTVTGVTITGTAS